MSESGVKKRHEKQQLQATMQQLQATNQQLQAEKDNLEAALAEKEETVRQVQALLGA